MNRIYKFVLILISSFIFSKTSVGQNCASVIVEAYPANPQMGMYNYFGARVTLTTEGDDDVVVTGYLQSDTDPGSQLPFTVTVYKGYLTNETGTGFQTDATGSASVVVTSISHCPGEIHTTYAGVTIAYEVNNEILRFNSLDDLNTVLDQLDIDYENHNQSYETTYASLTVDQMDDMDSATGFDEFYPYRVFENLFSGYTSKRMNIESIENTWLFNNLTGPDPDDGDLTIDDSENSIFNSNYSFKVENIVYQLTSTGLYVNGVLDNTVQAITGQKDEIFAGTETPVPESHYHMASGADERNASGPSADEYRFPFWDESQPINDRFIPGCHSNQKSILRYSPSTQPNTKYKLKVAVNSIKARSSAKGKVVFYKWKGSRWKRRRAELAVSCGGTIYSNTCSLNFQFLDRKPSPTGFKKRKQLKVIRRQWGATWKTRSGEVGASFDTPSGISNSVLLTF